MSVITTENEYDQIEKYLDIPELDVDQKTQTYVWSNGDIPETLKELISECIDIWKIYLFDDENRKFPNPESIELDKNAISELSEVLGYIEEEETAQSEKRMFQFIDACVSMNTIKELEEPFSFGDLSDLENWEISIEQWENARKMAIKEIKG